MAARGGFVSAARAFSELVRHIPQHAWSGSGLGEWDLRSLVRHTSNALTTVLTYLAAPASVEAVQSPEEYFAVVRHNAAALASGIAERGREAGARLGADPSRVIDALVAEALCELARQDDPVIQTRIGGMRLSAYLPTRTFELTVHSLDIAAAAGMAWTPPSDALAEMTALAARIACEEGFGSDALRALTGRAPLPPGFSVVG